MFKDNKFGDIFPTRTGASTGTSNERKMLDAIGGSDSYRTRIQNNADGSTTVLRTKNGMPQFSTTGFINAVDKCPDLYMESGVIDLVNTSESGGGVSGVWYAGTAASVDKWVGKVSNKNGKQGELRNTPVVTTQQISKAVPENSNNKKRVMQSVPASLYTGKMRKYVQALYGRDYASEPFPLNAEVTGVIAPYLSYNIDLGEGGYEKVYLTGNTGIYTDSEYRFWLVGINDSVIRICLLVCDTCTEKLRPLLKTATGDEYERIESYVLSMSRPSGSAFNLMLNVPALTAFGYGWHFNWSGTCADIVNVDSAYNPYGVGGGGTMYISTHYRINITRSTDAGMRFPDDSANWRATLETVEGPVEWKNRTHTDVISHPSWAQGMQFIFNGHSSSAGYTFGSEAPFYCFYNRDTLKVCRYSYVQPVTSSEAYANPPEWGNTGTDSNGMRIDFGEHTRRNFQQVTASSTISIGGVSQVAYQTTRIGSQTRGTYTWDGTCSGFGGGYIPTGSQGWYYLNTSNQVANYAERGFVDGPGWQLQNATADVHVEWSSWYFTESDQACVCCAVAFYDAEAAYVVADHISSIERTSPVTASTSGPNAAISSVQQTKFDGNLVYTGKFGGQNYGGTSLWTWVYGYDPMPTTVTETRDGTLVCGRGNYEVDTSLLDFGSMHQPNDFYGFSKFGVLTSAGVEYAYGFAVAPSTLPFSELHPLSLVGWV